MLRTTSSRFATALLAASLIGLGAPLMGAGPEVKVGGLSFGPPQFGKIKVRFGTPQRPQRPPVVVRHDHYDPCELNLSAFQSGGTIIVVARGANREAGCSTRFEACDLNGRIPEVHLVNARGHGHRAQIITPFEITGSFSARGQVSCIRVHVGHHVHEVRVVQTPCL